MKKNTFSSSHVGYVNKGKQDLNLHDLCMIEKGFLWHTKKIACILHEFIHAWGFHHEHNRPDRDKYVKVYKENIQDEKWANFIIQNKSCTFGLPYDGSSVMHYHSKAFIKPNLKKGSMSIKSLVRFDQELSFDSYIK